MVCIQNSNLNFVKPHQIIIKKKEKQLIILYLDNLENTYFLYQLSEEVAMNEIIKLIEAM